jgi:hypothetical protein
MSPIRYSITAHLDLLGFSSHLILADYDIRSTIGEQAIKRLSNIEDTIDLFEKERRKYPDRYPKKFHYQRFNDSLFLTIDIENDGIMPSVGDINISGQPSVDMEMYSKSLKSKSKNLKNTVLKKYYKDSIEIAKFVGLVSRIHESINSNEKVNNFPGCRTIISSGLRMKFFKKQKEDFFSANFSLANAYLANTGGAKDGFEGAYLFMEDNVARIISFNDVCGNILALSQYSFETTYFSPYSTPGYRTGSLIEKTPIIYPLIEKELFGKKYVFRNLNFDILSHLQLFPDYLYYIEGKKKAKENSALESIIKSLEKGIPVDFLEQASKIEIIFKYPLLYFRNQLGKKEMDSIFDNKKYHEA